MSGPQGLPAGASARFPNAPAAAFVLLLGALGTWFAAKQNVWIDESTQLSGAGLLPLGRMIRWLCGAAEPSLGVPADRMPPVSYLLDALALRGLGFGELALRVLHLACEIGGLAVLVRAIGRRFGALSAWTAAALLALSPRMVESGVELRAYPLFVGLTAAQVVLTLRRFDHDASLTVRSIVPLLLVSIVATYTHFFALVASSAFFVTLLVGRVRSGREFAALAGCYLLLLAAALGLIPFIVGSVAASDATTGGQGGVAELAMWPVRLIGHGSLFVKPIVAVLAIGGFVALLLASIGRAFLSPRGHAGERWRDPAPALTIGLAAALLVTVAAALVVKGFDPLKPSYSLWTWPVMVAVAVSALGNPTRVTLGCAALAVLGAALSTLLFASVADKAVHGPERALVEAIGSDPTGVVLVYEGEAWPYGFFPLQYRYAGRLDQRLLGVDGQIRAIRPGGGIGPATPLPPSARLLVARIGLNSYAALRHGPPAGSPLVSPDPALTLAGASVTHPGIYALELARYDRKDHR